MDTKRALLKFLNEKFDELLELDMAVARVLGAPAPHTLSSYAYELDKEGSLKGFLCRSVIDTAFKWLIQQDNHCKQDYERVHGLQREVRPDHRPKR